MRIFVTMNFQRRLLNISEYEYNRAFFAVSDVHVLIQGFVIFRDLFWVCWLIHPGSGLFLLLAAGLVCRAIAGARGCFTRLFEGDSLLSPSLLYVF